MDLSEFLDEGALAECAEAAEPMVRRLLAELSRLVVVEVGWRPVGSPDAGRGLRSCGFVVEARLWPAIRDDEGAVRTVRHAFVAAPKAYAAWSAGGAAVSEGGVE